MFVTNTQGGDRLTPPMQCKPCYADGAMLFGVIIIALALARL